MNLGYIVSNIVEYNIIHVKVTKYPSEHIPSRYPHLAIKSIIQDEPSTVWGFLSPAQLRSDMGFLAFSFPWSLGSGFYDEINGGQQKLVRTYLSYIFTKFQPIWISFGACISKTPCQTHGYRGMGLAWCFAYTCTKTNPDWSKFGEDIAQISVHQFSLSSINFVINSTPQGLWEWKGQKTCVTPYQHLGVGLGTPTGLG